MHIVPLSRPVAEGRLIKRLQTRGGMRWPGGSVGDAAQSFPPGRSKPHGSRRACRASIGVPDGDRQEARREPSAKARPPKVEESAGDEPGRLTDDHLGPCGASLQTPCAGRLGTWRTCGLIDGAPMPRGVGARGSSGPKCVPRALGTFGSGGFGNATRACPGPAKECGWRSVGYAVIPGRAISAFTRVFDAMARRTRNPYAAALERDRARCHTHFNCGDNILRSFPRKRESSWAAQRWVPIASRLQPTCALAW
jgi:hypothetical protein